MITVQTVPPLEPQQLQIEITFHYVRDLVEKCAQLLKKQNVKLYFDYVCKNEINSDSTLQEANINQIIYAKIVENQSEQMSQYKEVICWFRQDGTDLEQGISLRSDFTFEEVLDDALGQGIIVKIPEQIKVTNYGQTQILATLMEMQMFKLIEQSENIPQLTIHFTTDGREPQVDFIKFNQFPQNTSQQQGMKNVFQSSLAQGNKNQLQSQFINPQQQSFQITPNQQQFQQNNITHFPVQKMPQNFNLNNIQQSQQIQQGNVVQPNFIPQNLANKLFQLNQPNQSLNKLKGNPHTFIPNFIPTDKIPPLTSPNQNNIQIQPPQKPFLPQPNQQFNNNQQQTNNIQQQFNNTQQQPNNNQQQFQNNQQQLNNNQQQFNNNHQQPNNNQQQFNINLQQTNSTQQQFTNNQQQPNHNQQQFNINQQQPNSNQQQFNINQQQFNQQQFNNNQQLLEIDAIKTLENMAQKSLEQMMTLGSFSFQINQQGTLVVYCRVNPKISGYFLESRGKSNNQKNETNLKWETKLGVSIAETHDKGFIIKWKNNTYNSLSVNLL